MFNLILNEQMKLYRRIGTWVMIGLLLITVIGSALIINNMYAQEGTDDWRAQLTAENESYEKTLQNSSLPKASLDTFARYQQINEYRLANDIPPISMTTVWGFMIDSTIIISFITLFTIIVGAGTVASEFSSGTIKLLLIRPFSRSTILLSKYASTFIFALTLLLILFIFSFIVGSIIFGLTDISSPHLAYVNGEVVEKHMLLHILEMYGLNSVSLLMMVTFAFMISTIFRSNSLAIGLAIFLMFTGGQIVFMLSRYDWVKYILFANTDLTQYIDGVPLVEGMTMTFSITMLVIYFVAFNLLSWTIFQKRDVAA